MKTESKCLQFFYLQVKLLISQKVRFEIYTSI